MTPAKKKHTAASQRRNAERICKAAGRDLADLEQRLEEKNRQESAPKRRAMLAKAARSGSHLSRETVQQVISCRDSLHHYLERWTGGAVSRDEVTVILHEAMAVGSDWLTLRPGEILPVHPEYRFADDPRRLYVWGDFEEKGTDIADKVTELRKQAMGMYAAAVEEDQDSVNSFFADIAKGLDDVEEHAQAVTFMAERHAEFVAAHPQEFPVETYGVNGTPAEKSKVAS